MKFTFVDPAAPYSRTVPGRLAAKVEIPKWPGLALHRPDRIYETAPPLLAVFQEGAVTIGQFSQAQPPSYPPDTLGSQFLFVCLQKLGYQLHFSLAHPDVSWLTSTALTALLAAEVQAVGVPFSTHDMSLPSAPIFTRLLTITDLCCYK